MASSYTSNYQLCQWEGTDKVLRTDFNGGNQKIDAALKGLADRIGAETIRTVTAGTSVTQLSLSLTDVDWTKWRVIHLIVNAAANVTGRGTYRLIFHRGGNTYNASSTYYSQDIHLVMFPLYNPDAMVCGLLISSPGDVFLSGGTIDEVTDFCIVATDTSKPLAGEAKMTLIGER